MDTENLTEVIGPDLVPLRIFGNQIVVDSTRDGLFGIIDRHGVIHWIEINFG